jgi:hypothetical protein
METTMTDTYRLHPRQFAHMRELSDAVLARRPEVVGPYRMPEPPPRPVVVPKSQTAALVELTPGAKAEAFLLATLTPDAMPALEVQRLADAVGIKPRTLRRTRERMKIRVFKKGREARYWELPGTED